jgi:hypothetical protein
MDINRAGPRNAHLENQVQRTEPNGTGFMNPVTPAMDPASGGVPAEAPAGIARTDLRDAQKREEILNHCFGGMIGGASNELGVALTDAQKQNVLEFLRNDPLMRGKLLNYLEQIAK